MKGLFVSAAAVALSCAIAACDSAAGQNRAPATRLNDSARAESIAVARQDSINRAQPGYVVDSVLPVEEEIRRFRAKVGGTPVTSLANASASRDELVKRVIAAVERRDTVDMIKMLVSPREYADLIYPSSQYARPPYRLSPEMAWMQLAGGSRSGFTRLAQRRGDQQFKLASYACADSAERQGDNAFWAKCVLRLVDAKGEASTQRWFGPIVERGGRFKLLSFANQF